jgi:hypothetical protein
VSGDPEESGSENQSFRGQETLATRNRDPRYPDGESCGPQPKIVEYRWHSVRDREKVSLESFGNRIRDPSNSEIPIEAMRGVER